MSEPAPHLHVVVNPETGEQVGEEPCPGCLARDQEIAGLETEKRGWRTRYYNLRRDKERDARKNPLWPIALELFRYWKRACSHPRAEWTAERFWLVAPFLESHGEAFCRRGIAGAAFDPYVTRLKNGAKQRHDGWELIFRSAGKLEAFAARAPLDPLHELAAVGVPASEVNLALYAPDGATPWNGPLPEAWATS